MNKIWMLFVFFPLWGKSQVLYLDDLLTRLYYSNADVQKKEKIAFVLNQESNIITAKSSVESKGFDLIFFDRDSFFVDYLRRNGECNLIRLKLVKKSNDIMQVRVLFSNTNYEAYTNPVGNILAGIDDRIIFLRRDKSTCQWQYIKK